MSTGVKTSGGEGGIRTLGTGVSPYNGLANRRIRPLCHLSATISDSLPRCSPLQAEPFNPHRSLWFHRQETTLINGQITRGRGGFGFRLHSFVFTSFINPKRSGT
jgi:hypothetical protein